MNSKNKKALIQIHLAVLLFGTAGLFGKISGLHPLEIVFGRVFFASMALYLFSVLTGSELKIQSRKDLGAMLLLGVILAFHWFAFFKSIQLSTVATGLLTYSTFPVFVAIISPVFIHEKFRFSELAIALLGFAGVLLLVPEYDFHNKFTTGIGWGVLSGLSFALLAIFNRKYVQKYSGITIAFYEDVAAAIVLFPFLFFIPLVFSVRALLLIICLAVVFTAVAHTLFISGMKKVRAQQASIIANLEPLYGIVLAVFILKEIPSAREIGGGLIIMASVFYTSVKSA